MAMYRNWGDYFGTSKAENPKYDTRKPTPEELRIQKLFAIFQMTYLGAPMIYYGDEAGMWGANDPCCRKPMIWKDLSYDDEAYLPDGSKRTNPDTVAFNQELYNHYRKLIHIRNSHETGCGKRLRHRDDRECAEKRAPADRGDWRYKQNQCGRCNRCRCRCGGCDIRGCMCR